MTGNIYFIQVGTDGPIKIGYTTSDIRKRVRAFQLVSPHILRWIGTFPGTLADEKLAHEFLKNSALRGEWVYPTVEVLAFIAHKSPNFDPVIAENPFGHHSRPRSSDTRRRMAKSAQERWKRKSRETFQLTTAEKLETASQVFDALGGNPGVRKLTGAKPSAMSMWRQAESFPPNTSIILTDALRSIGKTAPDSLWRMKAPAEGAS